MSNNKIRTRFAPSPTGLVHIGNLRSALYEYLIAKSLGGKFIIRIEDTDQKRYVEGAVEVIFNTLKTVGIDHDEGPDIGGDFGPYVQSERKHIYLPYAKQLVESKHAYYCFCTEERIQNLREQAEKDKVQFKYDRHCLNLTKEEIDAKLEAKEEYVIRQFMPQEGSITYNDAVYGDITFDNIVLEDQVLIKSDGFPTYNFANVIDDHLMEISHVVRGSEYITSTPKYIHLYNAFGWEPPIFVHLPLVVNAEGGKLSKRSGDAYFSDLLDSGYLPEAVLNFIALLGWSSGTEQEFFTLAELEKIFDIKGISKSSSVYDTAKLKWMNAEYIRKLDLDEFTNVSHKWMQPVLKDGFDYKKVASMIQNRVEVLKDIPQMIAFLTETPSFDSELYINKKSKSDVETAKIVLPIIKDKLAGLEEYNHENIYTMYVETAKELELKNGTVMWPARIALSGMLVTAGGAVEITDILGRNEAVKRISAAIAALQESND